MSKHTPGPWEVSTLEINARYLNGIGDVTLVRRAAADDNRYVALAAMDGMGDDRIRTTDEERKANARLIAAAPDLLEAVRRAARITNMFVGVLKSGGYPIEETVKARDVFLALVAKAEGRA